MNWQEWKRRLLSPQELAQWAEGVDKRLGKPILSYASRIFEPGLLGRGFHVLEWSDERMGLRLSTNARSSGAFLTLGEFMLHAVMGRHLLLEQNRLEVEGVNLVLAERPDLVASLKMEIASDEREAWIKEAHQSAQGASREIIVRLWSHTEHRVGEIRFAARLTMRMALPS